MSSGVSRFKRFAGSFIALALLFAVMCFISVPLISWGISSIRILNDFSETTATVCDIICTDTEIDDGVIETENEVVFDYKVSGRQYQSKLHNDSGSYEIGDSVKILYDPEKPNDIAEKSWDEAIGATAIGFIFAVGAWLALHKIIFGLLITTQSIKKEFVKGFIENVIMLACSAAFAVLLLSMGINEINNRDSFVPTTATISRIESSDDEDTIEYTTYVDYTVNGKQYSNILYEYHSDYAVGKKVGILYNSENPDEMQSDSWTGINIKMGFGIGLGLIALFLLFRQIFYKYAFTRQQALKAKQML